MAKFSKTQIDKLGERLRDGDLTNDDLRMLNEYRHDFEAVYQHVVKIIRENLNLQPTGRSAKSTSSIIDKLRRPNTRGYRFSQIQDIAGCRIVVPDTISQQFVVWKLLEMFIGAKEDDLRFKPSHGYRAIHVVVKSGSMQVEIQVRTEMQHLWAEMCERLADEHDLMLKYGGGPEEMRLMLKDLSEIGHEIEFQTESLTEDQELDLKGRFKEVVRRTIILFGRKV